MDSAGSGGGPSVTGPDEFAQRKTADGARPVHLLTLTTLFPNLRQPRHGIFVANRLRKLCETGRVEAEVIAAVPVFPGAYRHVIEVPVRESMGGFDVRHPRYFQIPGVGMRAQPDALARAMLREIRRGGTRAVDVVDAHYFYPDGVAAARVADELDLPLVISARGSDINLISDMPFARERMLRAAKRAQALIAVSEALADRMRAIGMPSERIHVLRNGVDTAMFRPMPKAEARVCLGLDAGSQWILGVGNLVTEKGFDVLIRAVSELPDTRLIIIGEGPLRTTLQRLADSCAPGRVAFRGNMPQPNLPAAYSAADVLALPSLREGWPNVLLEAIACGTPVVAAAVGGVGEIIRPGAPGTMVGEHLPTAWRDALRQALAAPHDPERVRAYAFQFGWHDVVDRQCALYEHVARDWRTRTRAPSKPGALSHA
jgi:teichuronic acid biosynthesis glycosyltransferase TuaC